MESLWRSDFVESFSVYRGSGASGLVESKVHGLLNKHGIGRIVLIEADPTERCITDTPITCRARLKGSPKGIRVRRQVARAANLKIGRFQLVGGGIRQQYSQDLSGSWNCYATS